MAVVPYGKQPSSAKPAPEWALPGKLVYSDVHRANTQVIELYWDGAPDRKCWIISVVGANGFANGGRMLFTPFRADAPTNWYRNVGEREWAIECTWPAMAPNNKGVVERYYGTNNTDAG